jgi:hypothetical protein
MPVASIAELDRPETVVANKNSLNQVMASRLHFSITFAAGAAAIGALWFASSRLNRRNVTAATAADNDKDADNDADNDAVDGDSKTTAASSLSSPAVVARSVSVNSPDRELLPPFPLSVIRMLQQVR